MFAEDTASPVLLNPHFATGASKWHVDPIANIGMYFDDATHAADWFYWIFGRPVSVMAEIDNIVTDTAPDDNGVSIFRFETGIMGILFNGSTTAAGVNTTEIYGDGGTIIQDYGDAPLHLCAAIRRTPSHSNTSAAVTPAGPSSKWTSPEDRASASPPYPVHLSTISAA